MKQKIYYQKYLCLIVILGLVLPFTFPLNISAQNAGSWQTVAPASGSIIGREENTYAASGGKFYLLGGRGIVASQEYNPVNKTWVNKAAPPIEMNHFQAVTLNGLIYAVCAMNGPYPHEVPLSNVYVYNPNVNTWSKGFTIPSNRRRGAAGAVVYNNKIYVVGGIIDGHTSGWVNWFDEYNPATNTWTPMPNAPRTRDHFQAVIVNNKLYVAGGRKSAYPNTFNLTIPEVDVFDFVSRTWSTLPGSSNLPIPRAGAANVVLGNEVIVIGGESGLQTAAHKETHALNVTTNTWRRLADLQAGRHGTGAVINNQEIYIAAGAGQRGGTPKVLTQEKLSMSSSISYQVTSFTLVNSSTDSDIQTLSNGYVINLATISGKSINIRANTSTSTGSVIFNLSGQQSRTQTESTAPYALFGDVSGNYNNWTPTVGSYTLKATPYSASGGTGTAGTPLTISFSVTDQSTVTAQRMLKPGEEPVLASAKAYPNPVSKGCFNVLLPLKLDGEVSYTLMSLSGNRLTGGKLSLRKPASALAFDFSLEMISSGLYYLKLEAKNYKVAMQLISSK